MFGLNCRPRALGLLACLLILVFAAPAEARDLGDGDLFVAEGLYRVFDGASFPATFYSHEAGQRAWMEIEASPDYRSWAVFDWSSEEPFGYIGNDHQCFRLTLETGGFSSPARQLSDFEGGADAEPHIQLEEMARGLNVVDRFVVLNDDEAVVIFEVKEIETDVARKEAAAPPEIDPGECQPMRDLLDRLTTGADSRADSPEAPSAVVPSRLDRNHPYDFYGLGYHWLRYQGSVFSQSKPDYDRALSSCEADGPDKCKPYWVTGGLFGRYGRYCGDGWGTGKGDPVSSADYCCRLHDGQVWDRSGKFGHEARNLCGFAACLTCKYYVSLRDWEINFRGDFWASQPISAFVAAGVAAVWCYPQSKITGFHCR